MSEKKKTNDKFKFKKPLIKIKPIKFKSLDELNKDWKQNWNKFMDNINNFFGVESDILKYKDELPPGEEIPQITEESYSEDSGNDENLVERGSEGVNVAGGVADAGTNIADNIREDEPVEVEAELITDYKRGVKQNKGGGEKTEEDKSRANQGYGYSGSGPKSKGPKTPPTSHGTLNKPYKAPSPKTMKPKRNKGDLIKLWEQNWLKFQQNTIDAFEDMKKKIEEINAKNKEKMEQQILNGKVNWKIWLKKQEIKNKQAKEKRELALKRFNEWIEENQRKNKEFFKKQRELWQSQLNKWHEEQKRLLGESKEKWVENQKKLKREYEEWIQENRRRSLEKAKYKLRVGWRTNLYIMMSILPVVIIIALVIALINAITK
ncbi:MAG: hypothetical protein ACTSU2_14940 [Promethearchaeota archaeon]